MTDKKKKKFKETTIGKIALSAVSLVNPTIGSLLNGTSTVEEALAAVQGSHVPIEDKIRIRELLLDAYELEVQDRIGARQREARVAAAGGSDILFKTIGWGVLLAFLMMVSGALGAWEIPEANQRMFDMAFGAVVAKMTAVVGYYFGSSIGSKQKTHIMKGSEI